MGELQFFASSIAESFVLIDEIGFLAENERKDIGMSVLAKKENLTSSPTSSRRFLITTIGGRYLAFDAESIQGVLTNEEVSPFRDPVVSGRVYNVVNLTMRLNLPSEGFGDGTSTVLLAKDGRHGSVRVEKVHGMLEIQRSHVLPLPAQFRGPEQRWYLGMIPFVRSVALVLNITWVLEDQIQGVTSRTDQGGMVPLAAVQGAAESKSQRC